LGHRGLTAIETYPGVSTAVVSSLVVPMVLETLRQHGRVLLLPSASLDLSLFWTTISASAPIDMLHRQMRIVSPGYVAPPDSPLRKVLLPLPIEVEKFSMSPILRDAWEFVTKGGSATTANLAFFSEGALLALTRLTGSELTRENTQARVASYLNGESPVHVILRAGADGLVASAAEDMAEIYLRMYSREGRTFVYGMRPVTPGFLMTVNASGDRPYELLRIV
jgi:hypothetical protein